MPIYTCTDCNYSTDRFFNINKHKTTIKHVENTVKPAKKSKGVIQQSLDLNLNATRTSSDKKDIGQESRHPCVKCNKLLASRQSLHTHKKRCKAREPININNELYDKVIEENTKLKIQVVEYQAKIIENKLQYLEQENQMLKENLKEQKETLKEQTKTNNSLQNLAENSVKLSNKSMSALNYAVKYYANAPSIKIFNNFGIFLEGNEKYNLDEIMIHYYEKNKLCSYIGDKLIKEYKKADPVTQSMWVGDVNRVSYILKETNKNISAWNSDKEGVSMAKYMIKPALEHIRGSLLEYNNEIFPVIQENDLDESKRQELLKKMEISTNIVHSINNNELTEPIIRYMAPHFYLNRTSNNIELLDKE